MLFKDKRLCCGVLLKLIWKDNVFLSEFMITIRFLALYKALNFATHLRQQNFKNLNVSKFKSTKAFFADQKLLINLIQCILKIIVMT